MIRAVIIDDEPKGAASLEILLKRSGVEIEIVAIANNALEGIKKIKEHIPDILFLDVNMPVNSGFEVLDHIDRDHVFVVFTTAHEEYAIKAIKKNAFDYLLKPIDPAELVACLNRISESINKAAHASDFTVNPAKENPAPKKLSIPVKDGILYLTQTDVIRIEGSGAYSYIYLINKEKHLVSKSLKELEEQLDDTIFYRCHNSHIVNITKVKKFVRTDGNFVQMEDGSMAEISRTRKDEFMAVLS